MNIHLKAHSKKVKPLANEVVMGNDLALKQRKKESYKIFDEIAGTYDFLNHFLSLGIDIWWRRILLNHVPRRNSLVALDLATGTADVAIALGKDERFKHVTGLDLSQEMITKGRTKVQKNSLTDRVGLHIGNAEEIPAADEIFDLVTISFGIRNFSDPLASLKDIHRVLRPGGRCLIMEFAVPKSRLIRALYFFYFRNLLPFIGNLLSGHRDAYTYLNKTVEDFPYGDEFLKLMKKAGFKKMGSRSLTFGIAMIYQAEKE